MKNLLVIFLASWSLIFITTVFLEYGSNSRKLPRQDKDFLDPGYIVRHLYKFTNSTLAYKVLSQLDLEKTPETRKVPYGLGLKHDDDYCDKHRAYFTKHPELVFEQMNFVSNVLLESLFRSKVLPTLGKDIHPDVGPHMPPEEKKNPINQLELDANIFLTSNGIFGGLNVGQHFSCLSQISNHIPGHEGLISKDLVAKAATNYSKQFEDRPQCFNFDKIFPKTWILYEKEDCLDFFKEFNSPKYENLKKERGIVYISKIARYAHRAEGVMPVQEEEERRLRSIYDNGKKCGTVTQQYIVQNYIHNTLLLNGHRFDFRIYMLIASTNPLIAYYHDGIVRFTLSQYDTDSKDKKDLLPNAAVSDDIYNIVKEGGLYEGMDEEQLRRAHRKSYEELQALLLEAGATDDPNWIDNHLRPEIKKAMVHLLRMTSESFQKHSSLYELHGLDFVIDSSLNLWFIEANASPAFAKFSIPMEKFIVQMFNDQFEIVIGLLRSRMKRVIAYVNELISTGEAKVTDKNEFVMNNLEEKRERFVKLSQNYFEEEFMPRASNSFTLILDENLEGVERYQGLVSQECL